MRVLSGRDPHHIVEAQFKAFARAFRDAVASTRVRPGCRPPRAACELANAASSVVVLDYGSGNLRSAVRALERAGAAVELTGDRARRRGGRRAGRTRRRGLRRVHGGAARGRGPADHRRASPAAGRCSGICVGMQVLFERGVEHGVETEGCDEWPGVVERLQAPVVPHMGWNTVDVPTGSRLFAGLEDERFYFVHSYAARTWDLATNGRTAAPLVTWAEHGGDRFVAAVENGPLCATQFHPEKSGDAGAALLRNWVDSCERRGRGPLVPATGSARRVDGDKSRDPAAPGRRGRARRR